MAAHGKEFWETFTDKRLVINLPHKGYTLPSWRKSHCQRIFRNRKHRLTMACLRDEVKVVHKEVVVGLCKSFQSHGQVR